MGTTIMPGWGTAIGAILGGAMGGLSDKEKEGGDAGGEGGGGGMDWMSMLGNLGGGKEGGTGNGFDFSTILGALGGMGGGQESAPAEDPTQEKLIQSNSPFMPAQLMGFPSMSAPKVSEVLKNAMMLRGKGAF